MSTTDHFVAELQGRLALRADPKRRNWWKRYLRGEAEFRGVAMADIRSIVADLLAGSEWRDADVDVLIELAHACMRQTPTEDKLAGVLVLAEHAIDSLHIRHVDALAHPLAGGHLADWNAVDWYCVKVLGPFVAKGADVVARSEAVAGWRSASGLWQRRAAAVAFVNHAATEGELYPGFHDMLLEVARANAGDGTRWSQTSVGWLMRELSRHHPKLVEQFLSEHPDLSSEATRNARKYLDP